MFEIEVIRLKGECKSGRHYAELIKSRGGTVTEAANEILLHPQFVPQLSKRAAVIIPVESAGITTRVDLGTAMSQIFSAYSFDWAAPEMGPEVFLAFLDEPDKVLKGKYLFYTACAGSLHCFAQRPKEPGYPFIFFQIVASDSGLVLDAVQPGKAPYMLEPNDSVILQTDPD